MGFKPLQSSTTETAPERKRGFRPLTEAEAPVEAMSPSESAWKAQATTANPNATDAEIAAFMTEQVRATPRGRGFRPISTPKSQQQTWQTVPANDLAQLDALPESAMSTLFRLPDADQGLSFGQAFQHARRLERQGGQQPGTSVFKWKGKDFNTKAKGDPQTAPATIDVELSTAQPQKPSHTDTQAKTSPMLPGAGFSKALRQSEQQAARADMSHPARKPEPAAKPEGGAMKTMRAIGQVYPVAETAANVVSQGVALPVAGLAGLGTAAGNALGLTDAEPGSVVHDVVGALTYQPQTELGQHLTGATLYPFEKLAEVGRHAGDATLEATGSPLAATAVDTAVNALPLAVGPVTKAVRTAAEPAKPMPRPSDAQAAAVEAEIGQQLREQIEAETATSLHPNPARQRIEADRRAAVADAMDEANAELGIVIRPRRAQQSKEMLNGPEEPEGIRRVEADETALHRPTPQELQELRGYGDNSLSGVDGTIRALPGGHGSGTEPTALAGAEGRNQGVQPRELRVDDAEHPGAAPDQLQATGARRQESSAAGVVGEDRRSAQSDAPTTGQGLADGEAALSPLPRDAHAQGRQVEPAIETTLDEAAHQAATSPLNDKPMPTPAQIEAGTYPKGHLNLHGLRIAIENPAGSVRSGVSPEGKPWQTTMAHHYGYIKGSRGRDKDNVDVFLTKDAENADTAWVVDQINRDSTFDEHKVVIGPATEAEASAAYLANYEPGWQGLGAITPMPIADFKVWVSDPTKTRKPVAYRKPAPADEPMADTLAAHTPDTLNAWAPGANYAPLVDDAKLPASMAKTAADLPSPIRRENI